jgi:hypothetical protein
MTGIVNGFELTNYTNIAEHKCLYGHTVCAVVPVLQPSRFYPCLSGTTSKLWKALMFGNSVWHCVYKICSLFR